MSTIHSSCVPVGWRPTLMAGMANPRTVLSTEISSTGIMSTARPAHSRRPARSCGAVVIVMSFTVPSRRYSWKVRRQPEPGGFGRKLPCRHVTSHAGPSTRLEAMARNPTETKEKLLDAFDALLDERGTAGATLDAVAAKAGVSKGGLLYHFGSKAELVNGSL